MRTKLKGVAIGAGYFSQFQYEAWTRIPEVEITALCNSNAERAKGIIMRLSQITEEEAHKLIHKKSMDSCRSMKEIAESIILMDEFQK